MGGLQQAGRWDGTLLLVTADHGEEFWEHQGYGHGHALWEELIHVPLLVKFPRGTRPVALGGAVGAITSSIDLLPSLLAWLGVPVPAGLPGRDVFAGDFADHAYAERFTGRRDPVHALIQGDWKLITTAAKPLLFDLRRDPGELHDRAAEAGERLAELERVACRFRVAARRAPSKDHALSREEVESLRALGYLRDE